MFKSRGDLPAWRSLLFVPVVREAFVADAHLRGADGIILDLEDSVPESEKDRARTLLPAAVRQVGKAGADVIVCINRPWHRAFRDIEAAVDPQVAALMCPKVESLGHLTVIAEMLDTLERARGLAAGHTKLVALIETADAFFRAREIAKATPRLVALSLGAEDFALAVGMEPLGEAPSRPSSSRRAPPDKSDQDWTFHLEATQAFLILHHPQARRRTSRMELCCHTRHIANKNVAISASMSLKSATVPMKPSGAMLPKSLSARGA